MNTITTIRRTLGAAAVVATLALATGVGNADAASGSTGPHSSAIATSASAVELRSGPPSIKAVNRTTGVDQQWVVVQPVVYKWNGSAWIAWQTHTAIIGLATDSASPSVWYDFATRVQTSPSMTALMTSSGYYKLAYSYYWYTGNTVTGSDLLWATHTSPIGAVVPYCSR